MKIDNYRLMKVTYKVSNNNDFSVYAKGMKSISNDDFQVHVNALDIEPTYPFSGKETFELDAYIYVNDQLTSEDEIKDKLNELGMILDIVKA